MKMRRIVILLFVISIPLTVYFQKEFERKESEKVAKTLYFYVGEDREDNGIAYSLKNISQKNLNAWYEMNKDVTKWKTYTDEPTGEKLGYIKLTRGRDDLPTSGVLIYFNLAVKKDGDIVYLYDDYNHIYTTMGYKAYVQMKKREV